MCSGLLRASNDFGAELVTRRSDRFGLLAAVPIDDSQCALTEVARARDELGSDGYAVACNYNGMLLSDRSRKPVWAELDRRAAVVFAHPDAYTRGSLGRPSAVIEVAFENHPNLRRHALCRNLPTACEHHLHCRPLRRSASRAIRPIGSAWAGKLGSQSKSSVPQEMQVHLRRLYLDTAATCPTSLAALAMTTPQQLVYGSDCGVACTSEAMMDHNLEALLGYSRLTPEAKNAIGTTGIEWSKVQILSARPGNRLSRQSSASTRIAALVT
jgi:hypothetical protein